MVEIVYEQIKSPDALFQALFKAAPLGGGHNPGDQVKGERFFHPPVIAVDIERDPGLDKRPVRRLLPEFQFPLWQRSQAAGQMQRGGTRRPVCLQHFIEKSVDLVVGKVHDVVCIRANL